jgi:hypothetical protein
MVSGMLEYTKTVLQKVSFDAQLFRRELEKAIERLMPNELIELKQWLLQFVVDKPELKQALVFVPL